MNDNLRELAHSRFLIAQQVYRFTLTDKFAEIVKYKSADEIKKLIETNDLSGLRKLVQSVREENLGSKTMGELRQIGRKLCIVHYNNLPKASLLSAIAKKELEGGQIFISDPDQELSESVREVFTLPTAQ